MNFFDKLSYGFYWFEVCVKEWYDAVIIGYYDEDEQPSWDFFCHINCNYPLTYRITTSEGRMSWRWMDPWNDEKENIIRPPENPKDA